MWLQEPHTHIYIQRDRGKGKGRNGSMLVGLKMALIINPLENQRSFTLKTDACFRGGEEIKGKLKEYDC